MLTPLMSMFRSLHTSTARQNIQLYFALHLLSIVLSRCQIPIMLALIWGIFYLLAWPLAKITLSFTVQRSCSRTSSEFINLLHALSWSLARYYFHNLVTLKQYYQGIAPHPDAKNRGAELVMDVAPIATILRACNPQGLNYLPLVIDVHERHGFSLRLCVHAGFRLLSVISNDASLQWYRERWFSCISKLATVTCDKVCIWIYLFNLFIYIFSCTISLLANLLCAVGPPKLLKNLWRLQPSW